MKGNYKNDFSTFRNLLSSCKNHYKDSVAIIYKDLNGVTIKKTYDEFVKDVIGTSNWIFDVVEKQRGKKITVLSKNRYEYIVVLYACLCGAGVFTIIDFNATIENALDTIHTLEIDVVIMDKEYELKLKGNEIQSDNSVKLFAMDDALETPKFNVCCSESYEFEDCEADELHLLVGTSGTTLQFQKYVMLSAKNILTNAYSMNTDYIVAPQKVLLSLPLAHLYSIMANVIFPISHGDEIYIANGIYEIEKDIIEYNPTTVALVPLIAEGLLKKYKKLCIENKETKLEDVYGKNFCELLIGGAMISEELLHGYNDMGINIVRAYGMTETATNITVTKPISEEQDFKTVGYVMSCNEVKIVDNEILVKGNNVMMGYYQNPELTKETIVDGWLKTGDAGYLSEDGKLYVTGRIKSIIVLDNGENINPEEIESVFMAEECVDECVIFSVDDKTLNMVVYSEAYLKSQEELMILIKNVNKTLPYSRQISCIQISETPLPKTSVGKVMRKSISAFCEKILIYNEMKKIIGDHLYKKEIVYITTDFKDELGLSSLDMFSIWCEMEEKYNRKIEKTDFMKCRCIVDIYKVIYE